jgi:hypothetical protein
MLQIIAAARAAKPLVKPVLILSGLTIGGLIAWKILRKGAAFGRQIKEGSEFEKEKTNEKTLSYPKTQYKAWADSLEAAWYEYPFGLGTVDETVYNIMRQLKTNNDWLELQKAYGVRTYYSGGFAAGNYNLVETISAEDEGGEMRRQINLIFQKRGIKYRL